MKGISLIICCYNSSQRLPETIRHIVSQQVSNGINWELVIVNNASTDDTVAVAKTEWAKYNLDIKFIIVDQPIPGLSSARKKGIEVSKFDYLIFCDDDNWLDKNYVNNAYNTLEQHPDAGIIGGQSNGSFEIKKPFWFDDFAHSYVVEKPFIKSTYLDNGREYLAGAGMLIRKELINKMNAVGFEPILTGRIGKSLMSGEDYELCLITKYLGFKIYYDENLKLTHFMSKERLNWDYCIKMTTVGHAIPEVIYDLYRVVNQFSTSIEQRSFTRIYLRLIKNYYDKLLHPEYDGIKGLLHFLSNLNLFYSMKPGSVLQRNILSSKNKLVFTLRNRRKLKRYYHSIQELFARINNYKP